MENWQKIDAVQRMQDYIVEHYGENLCLEQLAAAAAYSPWQALRAFSELTGKTPFAYLRAVRLSNAARLLRDTDASILEIALRCAFNSHEGFTKAFLRQFGISPSQYREKASPLPYFTYYPIRHYYTALQEQEEEFTLPTNTVFTQIIERPARKLILKRGVSAGDYFAYCEEVGCDIWGTLESIKGALYESIGLWLPKKLRLPGTSEYCQGVEVPAGYAGPVPEGFDCICLPACKYMEFHGEPFPDEQFAQAVAVIWDAIDRYTPNHFGWEWAPEDSPRYQYAPTGSRGYIEGRPVREYRRPQ